MPVARPFIKPQSPGADRLEQTLEQQTLEQHPAILQQGALFQEICALLESFYRRQDAYLADFTIDLTIALARELGIAHTQFKRSSALQDITGVKTDRLIQILQRLGAQHYLSGPSAKDYIEDEKFVQAGISLAYIQYNYPEYPQLYPPYDPQVSIIDLLMMTGPDALRYIVS